MKLAELSDREVASLLCSNGINFRAGAFKINLRSSIPAISAGIRLLYSDAEIHDGSFSDFHVQVVPSSGFRRWIRPRVHFCLNGYEPFFPMPYDQALPLLEWGLNWCVTNHCHQYLVIHAAVVEKNNKIIVLPGTPGSGKSTLSAALVSCEGWRLLSDELTIFDLDNNVIIPNPRPVSLKNQSIDIIKNKFPNSIFSPTVHDTLKGSVAHMKPSKISLDGLKKYYSPSFVIFPKYIKDQAENLSLINKGDAFLQLAEHSFNYQILREHGFLSVAKILDQSQCYSYVYDGDLDKAIKQMDTLVS